jgi:hypothetical protein
MAKTNPLFILVIVLVGVFILLLLASRPSYLPYDNDSRNYANYEPMTGLNDKKEVVAPTTKPTANATTNNSLSSILPASMSMSENFEPMVEVPQSIKYGPLRDSEVIDKFSQVTTNGMEGVNGCVSSGLSNSGGYICLTPELIKLLKTRGGNASGI